MSDVDSLPEFSEDEEVAEITEEIADDGKKKKKEKVKSKFQGRRHHKMFISSCILKFSLLAQGDLFDKLF